MIPKQIKVGAAAFGVVILKILKSIFLEHFCIPGVKEASIHKYFIMRNMKNQFKKKCHRRGVGKYVVT